MADAKTSALTAVGAAAGAQEMPVNEGGTEKKLTISQIVTYLATIGIVPRIVKQKAADEFVNASTTLQDDNDLQFPIGANEVYIVEGCLWITSNTSADFKMAVTIPTGATMQWELFINVGTTVTDELRGTVSGTSDSTGSSFTNTVCRFRARVTNSSTAGDVKIQWAQLTSHASNTTVEKHSFIVATKQ